MTTAEDVLNKARSQIGTKESPPNSNRTPYGAWYGQDGQPWCAQFVSWCFAMAGMPLHITTDKGYAYCPFGVNYFKKIGCWSATPSTGAIVFYGSPSESVHTGIVESFDATTITAIEGNTAVGNDANGGEVMRRVRPRNNWILGYGLPSYSAPQPKVKQMFDPAVRIDGNVVATCKSPNGGVWQVTDTWAVYAWEGAPFHGAFNGDPNVAGRHPATIGPEMIDGKWTGYYVITATSGETYVAKKA